MIQQPISLKKTLSGWLPSTVLVTALSLGAAYYSISQAQKQIPTPVAAPKVAPAKAVTALGRVEPRGEVIKLSVANAQDSRVNKLLVEEGSRVASGQVIAILQGLDKKQAALAEAEQNVAVARAKLAQVQAGDAKAGEIAAQKAAIARIQAQLRTETLEKQAAIARVWVELRNAEKAYQRYQTLYQEGAVSAFNLDDFFQSPPF